VSEIIELWSLPWHAKLRSLANEFDAAASTAAAKLDSSCTRAAVRPSSWLVRARSAARLTSHADR
jgi:hypothetical protein